MVMTRGVDPVEACVEGRVRRPGRVRETEVEAGQPRREVGVGRKPVHDRGPRRAGVGALVDLVAPERRVQRCRAPRVEAQVGRAERPGGRGLEQRPRSCPVMRLPDAEGRVDRRRGAAVAAAAAEDRGVEVVGVTRVHRQPRRGDAEEEVPRDVAPGEASVGRLQDAVAEVAVSGQSTFPGAGVDDEVVGGGHLDRPDRGRRKVVSSRHPCAAVVGRRPDAALGGAQDERAVLPDGQRSDAPALGRERVVAALDLDDGVGPERAPGAGEGRRPRGRGILEQLGLVGGRLAQGHRLVDAQRRAAREPGTDECLVAEQELGLELVVELRDLGPRRQERRVLAGGGARPGRRRRDAWGDAAGGQGESQHECAQRTPTTLPHLLPLVYVFAKAAPSRRRGPPARVRTSATPTLISSPAAKRLNPAAASTAEVTGRITVIQPRLQSQARLQQSLSRRRPSG